MATKISFPKRRSTCRPTAKPALIEAADLVTEMTQIKHPFREQNVRAQKGIEF